jgi:ribonuclease P protein component
MVYMLPKSKRLTKKDFVNAPPKKTIRGTHFDVAISKSNVSKFACVISKKRFKLAVDRNRVKRKTFALLKEIHPNSSHSIIIYPKQTVLDTKTDTLKEEMKNLFATL